MRSRRAPTRSSAATPLAPILLRRRLGRGKEHPARLNERRGETAIPRPPGALIWSHGASVGEMLSLLPLIEHLRARRFPVLVTSGTVTSANLAERRLPPGVILESTSRGIPLILLNGRLSERSYQRWRYAPGSIAALLRCFDVCLAQSELG